VRLEEVPTPKCSSSKLSQTLGFTPAARLVEAGSDMLTAIDIGDRSKLTDPRYDNIRWLEYRVVMLALSDLLRTKAAVD
jgi:hypothetical protein